MIEPPPPATSRWSKVTRFTIAAGYVSCALTLLGVVVVTAESAVVGWPVITVAGILLLLRSRFEENRRELMWLGIAHIGICVLFVSLVNLFHWSPRAARVPFAVMGVVYIAMISRPTWTAWQRSPHVPGRCDGCGYALLGLPEPRCPECGREFDPAELAAVPVS